ncbi:MAG: hypothetical protein ACT4OS_04515 [Acidimicrobiales bacterium]
MLTIRTRRRAVAAITGTLLGATTLLAGAGPAPAAEEDKAPAAAHWGRYQWDGGKIEAKDRAFWLFDRTDDPMLHSIIEAVAASWNAAREQNLALDGDKAFETPFVRVHRDDKNAGQCFVNETAGYSVASACKLPFGDFKVISARSTTDKNGHLRGGAFALGEGLEFADAVTAVCRGFGVIMGIDPRDADPDSCMTKDSVPKGKLLWYGPKDIAAINSLYKSHKDKATKQAADAKAPGLNEPNS